MQIFVLPNNAQNDVTKITDAVRVALESWWDNTALKNFKYCYSIADKKKLLMRFYEYVQEGGSVQ